MIPFLDHDSADHSGRTVGGGGGFILSLFDGLLGALRGDGATDGGWIDVESLPQTIQSQWDQIAARLSIQLRPRQETISVPWRSSVKKKKSKSSRMKKNKRIGKQQSATVERWSFTLPSSRAAAYFCRSAMEVLLDLHIYPRTRDFLPLWDLLAVQDDVDFVKVGKYLTVWPMAVWLRNSPPPAPQTLAGSKFPLPFKGALRNHLRNLIRSRSDVGGSRPARAFCTAWLQGVKRGTDIVPDTFVNREMEAHKEALSRPITLDPEFIPGLEDKFSKIWCDWTPSKKSWGCKVDDLPSHWIPGESYVWKRKVDIHPPRYTYEMKEPHVKASHEFPRSLGGRQGYLNWISRDHTVHFTEPELHRMVYSLPPLPWVAKQPKVIDPMSAVGGSLCPGDWVDSCISPPPLHRMWEVRGTVYEHHCWDRIKDSDLLQSALFRHGYQSLLEDRDNYVPRCQVSPVLEPFKARLITKGPSVAYGASTKFQRQMWNHLRKSIPFTLIGRPMDQSDLYGIIEREKKLGLSKFTDWVSGDYKAATDGLSLEVNRLAIAAFAREHRLTEKEAFLCEMVSGPHDISYPCSAGIDRFTQTNGQLMGSPLSFPLLCVINLAAYWSALEEYTGRSFSWRDLPVLVNGDDILFRANPEFYTIWQKWVSRVGFTLSVGKNYIHPKLLTINSEFYWFSQDQKKYSFSRQEFLNVGLLTNQHCGREPMPWTCKVHWALLGAQDKARAQRRIRHYYREEIRQFTCNGHFNLHAAVDYGGLGICSEGSDVYYTPFQRRYAAFCHATRMGTCRLDTNKGIETFGPVYKLRKAVPKLFPSGERYRTIVWRDRFEPDRENEVRVQEPLNPLKLTTWHVPHDQEKSAFELCYPRKRLKTFRKGEYFKYMGNMEQWGYVAKEILLFRRQGKPLGGRTDRVLHY